MSDEEDVALSAELFQRLHPEIPLKIRFQDQSEYDTKVLRRLKGNIEAVGDKMDQAVNDMSPRFKKEKLQERLDAIPRFKEDLDTEIQLKKTRVEIVHELLDSLYFGQKTPIESMIGSPETKEIDPAIDPTEKTVVWPYTQFLKDVGDVYPLYGSKIGEEHCGALSTTADTINQMEKKLTASQSKVFKYTKIVLETILGYDPKTKDYIDEYKKILDENDEDEVDTLKRELIQTRTQNVLLKNQLKSSKDKITKLEDRKKQLLEAYVELYNGSVDFAQKMRRLEIRNNQRLRGASVIFYLKDNILEAESKKFKYTTDPDAKFHTVEMAETSLEEGITSFTQKRESDFKTEDSFDILTPTKNILENMKKLTENITESSNSLTKDMLIIIKAYHAFAGEQQDKINNMEGEQDDFKQDLSNAMNFFVGDNRGWVRSFQDAIKMVNQYYQTFTDDEPMVITFRVDSKDEDGLEEWIKHTTDALQYISNQLLVKVNDVLNRAIDETITARSGIEKIYYQFFYDDTSEAQEAYRRLYRLIPTERDILEGKKREPDVDVRLKKSTKEYLAMLETACENINKKFIQSDVVNGVEQMLNTSELLINAINENFIDVAKTFTRAMADEDTIFIERVLYNNLRHLGYEELTDDMESKIRDYAQQISTVGAKKKEDPDKKKYNLVLMKEKDVKTSKKNIKTAADLFVYFFEGFKRYTEKAVKDRQSLHVALSALRGAIAMSSGGAQPFAPINAYLGEITGIKTTNPFKAFQTASYNMSLNYIDYEDKNLAEIAEMINRITEGLKETTTVLESTTMSIRDTKVSLETELERWQIVFAPSAGRSVLAQLKSQLQALFGQYPDRDIVTPFGAYLQRMELQLSKEKKKLGFNDIVKLITDLRESLQQTINDVLNDVSKAERNQKVVKKTTEEKKKETEQESKKNLETLRKEVEKNRNRLIEQLELWIQAFKTRTEKSPMVRLQKKLDALIGSKPEGRSDDRAKGKEREGTWSRGFDKFGVKVDSINVTGIREMRIEELVNLFSGLLNALESSFLDVNTMLENTNDFYKTTFREKVSGFVTDLNNIEADFRVLSPALGILVGNIKKQSPIGNGLEARMKLMFQIADGYKQGYEECARVITGNVGQSMNIVQKTIDVDIQESLKKLTETLEGATTNEKKALRNSIPMIGPEFSVVPSMTTMGTRLHQLVSPVGKQLIGSVASLSLTNLKKLLTRLSYVISNMGSVLQESKPAIEVTGSDKFDIEITERDQTINQLKSYITSLTNSVNSVIPVETWYGISLVDGDVSLEGAPEGYMDAVGIINRIIEQDGENSKAYIQRILEITENSSEIYPDAMTQLIDLANERLSYLMNIQQSLLNSAGGIDTREEIINTLNDRNRIMHDLVQKANEIIYDQFSAWYNVKPEPIASLDFEPMTIDSTDVPQFFIRTPTTEGNAKFTIIEVSKEKRKNDELDRYTREIEVLKQTNAVLEGTNETLRSELLDTNTKLQDCLDKPSVVVSSDDTEPQTTRRSRKRRVGRTGGGSKSSTVVSVDDDPEEMQEENQPPYSIEVQPEVSPEIVTSAKEAMSQRRAAQRGQQTQTEPSLRKTPTQKPPSVEATAPSPPGGAASSSSTSSSVEATAPSPPGGAASDELAPYEEGSSVEATAPSPPGGASKSLPSEPENFFTKTNILLNKEDLDLEKTYYELSYYMTLTIADKIEEFKMNWYTKIKNDLSSVENEIYDSAKLALKNAATYLLDVILTFENYIEISDRKAYYRNDDKKWPKELRELGLQHIALTDKKTFNGARWGSTLNTLSEDILSFMVKILEKYIESSPSKFPEGKALLETIENESDKYKINVILDFLWDKDKPKKYFNITSGEKALLDALYYIKLVGLAEIRGTEISGIEIGSQVKEMVPISGKKEDARAMADTSVQTTGKPRSFATTDEAKTEVEDKTDEMTGLGLI
jgi:hypothetical protein